eukprot:6213109-Pleurochrysis_carterae.AAC.5
MPVGDLHWGLIELICIIAMPSRAPLVWMDRGGRGCHSGGARSAATRHRFWLKCTVFYFALPRHAYLWSAPRSAPQVLDHHDAHGCHCLTRPRPGATHASRA